MPPIANIGTILLIAIVVLAIVVVFKAVIQVHQGHTVIVERLGKFHTVLTPGLHFLVPFIDSVRQRIDMREQVVSFPPQSVITSDNIVVSIDTVIYYQVTQPQWATYEIANPLQAIEQLAVTTLRNIIGSMDMEQALTGRDQINGQLRGVLDEATGRWGIRVSRVELKAIDPPATVQSAMEQQMKAERDRRAAILTAEGVKQSEILTAEGEKQSAILRAEGQAQATILKAQGESRAILQVFDAIHRGNADPKLLSYEYLKMLPQIANSSSSKLWIVPTELTAALDSVSKGFAGFGEAGASADLRDGEGLSDTLGATALQDIDEALADARSQASKASNEAEASGTASGSPFDPDAALGQAPNDPNA
ncbi:regulator of protease activity HflC (stomatin/prohibitin superfamily) [Arcanobacterium wilhelmae]|uniref:Regulator of protease activity HflC (Stomatin/prohibitin superfamily) n=1 Tax=Arcanobacterium wilhelmae TaxID=1803177 RepID=A0ABT9N8T2_9ACTO|nr:SPFH domain-containing protein [Arcanobacterium wilhelmae]MDP9799953.1 regulator of protease activity HflC (stomatin/prohibitin superfamily) [Arcanobacterium wilhelmae]WFN91087.1 SPFH/Band 7/PHB domain protein [Arcanobacterium wilhelmae]